MYKKSPELQKIGQHILSDLLCNCLNEIWKLIGAKTLNATPHSTSYEESFPAFAHSLANRNKNWAILSFRNTPCVSKPIMPNALFIIASSIGTSIVSPCLICVLHVNIDKSFCDLFYQQLYRNLSTAIVKCCVHFMRKEW